MLPLDRYEEASGTLAYLQPGGGGNTERAAS